MRYCSISAGSQIGGRDPTGLNDSGFLLPGNRDARFVESVGYFENRKSWLLRQDGQRLALRPLSWPRESLEAS
jgi:hypothetical protein